MRLILLLAVLVPLCATSLPAAGNQPPELRVSVQPESAGRDRPNKTTSVNSRCLAITVENCEHHAIPKLTLRWKIVARDMNSRKISIAAAGSESLSLGADATTTTRTGIARFTEREGKTKRVGKGKNRRTVTGPDTGSRYAGYVVEIFRNGKLVAESSTVGMRERTKGMGKK